MGDDSAGVAPFPPGEAILRIGDRYVFGETAVVARDDFREGDVECLDVTDGASILRCAYGAQPANLPLGAVGLPVNPAEAAALLRDADTDLRDPRLRLGVECSPHEPGLGVVRDRSGRTFRVIGVAFVADGYPLERTVRIAYAEVPSRAGGGTLALPVTTPAPEVPTLHDLEAVIDAGSVVPGEHVNGQDFAPFLRGPYERLADPPAELVLEEGKYLVLEQPLSTSIEFKGYSGLVASRGIGASGRVNVRSYTGIAVRGEMAGEIETNSYAYVHVAGDLTGKLIVRSYATVVIDGDLRGEVAVASYATLLLRGRILGQLTFACGYVDVWLQRRTDADEVPRLPDALGSPSTLHLRESDLGAGTHERALGWARIVVGEEAWSKVAR